MAEERDRLRVGRLTKAHGLKGGLKLELFTDDPDRRFAAGSQFTLQVPETSPWHGRMLEISELRWYNGHPVGFFAGVDDRSAAESLAKAILWIERDDAEPAEDDAWYDHQLVGLAVHRDGERVGTVARVDHFPAQDLLAVRTVEREVLVPFVKAMVPTVDVEAGHVVVTPPPGLFEDLPDQSPSDRDPSGETSADGASADDAAAGDEARDDDATPSAPASHDDPSVGTAVPSETGDGS